MKSLLGGTGQRQTGKFLQKRVPKNAPFPCKTRGFRSPTVPESVHELRPGYELNKKKISAKLERNFKQTVFLVLLGDIDIVAAVGDSLTSATAANSAALWEVLVENRGLSWCIGGLFQNKFITKKHSKNWKSIQKSKNYSINFGKRFKSNFKEIILGDFELILE